MSYIFREHLRGMDLGLRGYALTKNKQVLSPYENALVGNTNNLRNLDSLFKVQKLDTALAHFEKIKQGINDYVEVTKAMKAAVERDSIKQFVNLLNQDKGYDLWVLFSPFNDSIVKYEDVLIAKAEADYEAALDRNIFTLVILLVASGFHRSLHHLHLHPRNQNKRAASFRFTRKTIANTCSITATQNLSQLHNTSKCYRRIDQQF